MAILCVVGARPNYMKMAPVVRELERRGFRRQLVHTGQHYDAAMSKVFFDDLGLPAPDFYLGIGSDTHARQTARALIELEKVIEESRPQLVIVAGDVTSTLAAALAAVKLLIPVAHVEAGLRSFDRTMPEEINRIVADHLSDLLFTTEASGDENLAREGIEASKIHFVGNCMVDTLLAFRDQAVAREPWIDYGLKRGEYGLVTLHRPSNVDSIEALAPLLEALGEISLRTPLLFPIHPRTRKKFGEFDLALPKSLQLSDPLPYIPFLGLMAGARLVLTDSGGIQEETTAMDVPCLTLRENTERPVTVTSGSNRLVGSDPSAIRTAVDEILWGSWKRAVRPPLWDGGAAGRIVEAIHGWAQAGGIELESA